MLLRKMVQKYFLIVFNALDNLCSDLLKSEISYETVKMTAKIVLWASKPSIIIGLHLKELSFTHYNKTLL